ncbi:MAG TPA: hypothetical protein VJA47_02465, partial [archaeon]|nr:hypothetical protein [archaeon]
MISYIQKYGEPRTRNIVVAALYVLTGKYGRRKFSATEIRHGALDLIRGFGEDGSISPETVKRVMEPINGDVLEFADRRKGTYQLKPFFRVTRLF